MRSWEACGLLLALTLGACRTTNDQSGVASAEQTITADESPFVTVKDGHLSLRGKPYNFYSSNSYRMIESNSIVDQTFANAQKLGLNAMRFWGFNNGEPPNGPNGYLFFNQTPGTWPPQLSYPESTWRQLDYVLKRAADYKIRLIIPLNNFWDGGIDTLARWTGDAPDQSKLSNREIFYTNPKARELYTSYVNHMMSRVNTYTGVAYKDDPIILMWETMNEARGRADPSGRTVADWLDFAGGVIKAADPHHLVGSGTEGFLNKFTPTVPIDGMDYNQEGFDFSSSQYVSRVNPENNQTEGGNTVAEGSYYPDDCASPNIDLCSFHAWPYNWSVREDLNNPMYVAAFIRAHREIMDKTLIKKPLYLAEFGRQVVRSQDGAMALRDKTFKNAYAEALNIKIDGIGYWNMGFGSVQGLGNGLTFDILCDPNGSWDSTCDIVKDYIRQASAYNAPDPQPVAPPVSPAPVIKDDPRSKYCPRGIDTSAKQLCNANDSRWYCLFYNNRWCVVPN